MPLWYTVIASIKCWLCYNCAKFIIRKPRSSKGLSVMRLSTDSKNVKWIIKISINSRRLTDWHSCVLLLQISFLWTRFQHCCWELVIGGMADGCHCFNFYDILHFILATFVYVFPMRKFVRDTEGQTERARYALNCA